MACPCRLQPPPRLAKGAPPARHNLQVGGEDAEVGGYAGQAQVRAVYSHQHPVGLTVTGGGAASLASARSAAARAFGRRRVQPEHTEEQQSAGGSRRRRGGVHGARARERRRRRGGFAEQPRAPLSSPGVVTGGCREAPPALSWARSLPSSARDARLRGGRLTAAAPGPCSAAGMPLARCSLWQHLSLHAVLKSWSLNRARPLTSPKRCPSRRFPSSCQRLCGRAREGAGLGLVSLSPGTQEVGGAARQGAEGGRRAGARSWVRGWGCLLPRRCSLSAPRGGKEPAWQALRPVWWPQCSTSLMMKSGSLASHTNYLTPSKNNKQESCDTLKTDKVLFPCKLLWTRAHFFK